MAFKIGSETVVGDEGTVVAATEVTKYAWHHAESMEIDLFQSVEFTSHSGLDLNWKIEMDALNANEWNTIAKMIVEYSSPFSEAIGIPSGGVKLAELLNEYATKDPAHPICIVDDVLTTGKSFEYFLDQYF